MTHGREVVMFGGSGVAERSNARCRMRAQWPIKVGIRVAKKVKGARSNGRPPSSSKQPRGGGPSRPSQGSPARGLGRNQETSFHGEPFVGKQLDYEVLDSGAGEKLERFGDFVLIRPAAQALWRPRHPELWSEASARFERDPGGRGQWQLRRKLPEAWRLELANLVFTLKTTSFGHVGLFPEQLEQWRWIQESCPKDGEVLNLFAYTGGSSLAAARAGAKVCHVDAARGIVDWARENAARSGLADAPIRWIVDDVQAFLEREVRRERRYSGLILDPPSFGRGKNGEVWKLESDLPRLLDLCRQVLAEDARFVLLSGHSGGFTPVVLARLIPDIVGARGGVWESGEMLLDAPDPKDALPTGCFARWRA
jgi:23S rRNA (cytosine1962-C5)-methyltransferase